MIMLKTLFLVFTTVYTFLNNNIYHAGKSQDYDLVFTLEVVLVKNPSPIIRQQNKCHGLVGLKAQCWKGLRF